MAQSVEPPDLDVSSGHDPRVMGSRPCEGSALSGEPTWDSLSPLPQPLHRHVHALSQINLKTTTTTTKATDPENSKTRKVPETGNQLKFRTQNRNHPT